jgi:gamma-glutamyltranspeptidase / glutathione hydrolase
MGSPSHARGRFSAALLAWVLAASLAACAETAPAAHISEPTAKVARSTAGMVASAAVPATEVGARVLAEGGNAVDAAVATGFALAVVEPSMSGIAGRASIVIRTSDGRVAGIDGLNQVPAGFRDGAPAGYDRAAVPGALAALTRALEEYGTWPLARVMAPAIRLAEDGFVLEEGEAGRFASAVEDLARHPSSSAVFLRSDGMPYEAGERFRQPELARMLRAVAEEGPSVFYQGWIADSIHADMARHGGFITREDLAGYRALDAIPVEGSYRGHTVLSNFRPASGHAVIQALKTLEEVPGSEELLRNDVHWALLVGQAMHFAIADRNRREGSEEESAGRLTSREHARARAGELRVPETTTAGARAGARGGAELAATGSLFGDDPESALSRRAAPGPATRLPGAADPRFPWRPGELVSDPADREATTHFSVADADGTVVAVTQSLGPSLGTRLVAPGLGFLYATRLGSEPGSRPSSTIAPTVVLGPGGEPLVALGGAGDARIISAVIQVLSRSIDQGLSPEEALRAPRVHPDGPAALRVEEGVDGWDAGVRSALEAAGFEISTAPPGFFGRVHAVWSEAGEVVGAAEPRWAGSAAGPLPPGAR